MSKMDWCCGFDNWPDLPLCTVCGHPAGTHRSQHPHRLGTGVHGTCDAYTPTPPRPMAINWRGKALNR